MGGQSLRIALLHPFLLIRFYRTKFQSTSKPLDSTILADVFVKYGASRYGASARQGYLLAGDAAELSRWENSIPRKLKDIPDVDSFVNDIEGAEIDYTSQKILNVSSHLVSIYPDSERMPEIVLVSKYIAVILYDTVLKLDHQMFWRYFNQFWRVPQSHGAAGWLWEAHAIHHVLHGSDDPWSHTLLALTKPHTGSLVVELPFRDLRSHGDAEDLANRLVANVPSGRNCLFTPGAKNQATFDAFSISDTQNVSLFQITIARGKHSIKAAGLDFLWNTVSRAKSLASHPSSIELLTPTHKRKWRLIFVVPRRVAHDWTTCQVIDFGGVQPKRAWNDYIEQFVMVLGDGHSAESDEITESSLGKRGQDRTEFTLKPAKAAHVEMDNEVEEADLAKKEGKKKATSLRPAKKQKSRIL